MSRKSKGRQKLEMVKIPKESNLLVTFSKRKYGVFKKASELATLCGAEITIIVFSPGRKIFSFGHPSVETVIDRFLSGNPPPTSGAMQLVEAYRHARVCELNMELNQIVTQLEMEKKRGEELEQMGNVSEDQRWWESPIEELDLPRLEQLKASLEVLRQNVTKRAEQVLMHTTNHPLQFYTPKPGTGPLPFDPKSEGFNTNMMPAYNFNLGFHNGNELF
ncbi:agamous-like MADS-box protein AGL62 [Hevea brasiliensis]|nr:agamous-like MADS-box protein AGL62 [Hevea brasiliensis]